MKLTRPRARLDRRYMSRRQPLAGHRRRHAVRRPVEEGHAKPALVMSPEDMVDAGLASLDQGEIVTIPSLPDKAEWDRSICWRNRG